MNVELKPEPFTQEQLDKIRQDLRLGRIRRFGAIVSHYKLGFIHNALIAWKKKSVSIPLSQKLKDKDYISHIYLRKSNRLWPYSLYTMIHARTKEELSLFINELSGLLNRSDCRALNTLRELKKTSFNPRKIKTNKRAKKSKKGAKEGLGLVPTKSRDPGLVGKM